MKLLKHFQTSARSDINLYFGGHAIIYSWANMSQPMLIQTPWNKSEDDQVLSLVRQYVGQKIWKHISSICIQ